MKQVKILSIFMLVTMMATMFAGCSKDESLEHGGLINAPYMRRVVHIMVKVLILILVKQDNIQIFILSAHSKKEGE